MTPADQYRKLAAQLEAKARAEADAQLRAEWRHLAKGYLRLAEQTDRSRRIDLSYEPILRPRGDGLGREPSENNP